MSDRPLVSVLTGTWNRHGLLLETIQNVRTQTYRPLEHVIVHDGPDLDDLGVKLYESEQRHRAATIDAYVGNDSDFVPIRFVDLGRHWSSFLAASISAVPFQVAQWLARGDYLCWWADDERASPDHVESLVDLLEATDSDFVYPYVRLVPGPGVPLTPHVIGSDPPRLGQITHALFRADLLDYRGFTTHVGSATDWDQVSAWVAAGARWAMLPEVTFEHRIDKLGEGAAFRAERRPLRGHQVRTA